MLVIGVFWTFSKVSHDEESSQGVSNIWQTAIDLCSVSFG